MLTDETVVLASIFWFIAVIHVGLIVVLSTATIILQFLLLLKFEANESASDFVRKFIKLQNIVSQSLYNTALKKVNGAVVEAKDTGTWLFLEN